MLIIGLLPRLRALRNDWKLFTMSLRNVRIRAKSVALSAGFVSLRYSETAADRSAKPALIIVITAAAPGPRSGPRTVVIPSRAVSPTGTHARISSNTLHPVMVKAEPPIAKYKSPEYEPLTKFLRFMFYLLI